jgi:hypothetical protein
MNTWVTHFREGRWTPYSCTVYLHTSVPCLLVARNLHFISLLTRAFVPLPKNGNVPNNTQTECVPLTIPLWYAASVRDGRFLEMLWAQQQQNCMHVSYTLLGAVAQLVEAQCYKPEGRRLHSRLGHWIFLLTRSYQPHYGPGVGSSSSRNE